MDNLHAGQYHLKLCWQLAADRRILHKKTVAWSARYGVHCAAASADTDFNSLNRFLIVLRGNAVGQLLQFWTLTPECLNFFMHDTFELRISCQQLTQECGQHRSIQPQKVVTKFCPQTIDFQKRILSCFEFLGALSSLYLSIDLPFASWKTHCHFSTLPYGLLP